MVQLNLALREINCKVVYFGCGLGGKTTNLEIVHQKAAPDSRGDLTSIATESDRTLFFDFMPLDLGEVSGMRIKFQLYTVPGQVYYNSTRKLVLRGADGVIFIADSQASKLEENIESIDNLEECLKEQGRSLDEMPHVIQFNKRDLDDVLTMDELERQLNRYGATCNGATASTGEGVLETFKALAAMMLDKIKAMSTESSAKIGNATSSMASVKPNPAPTKEERDSQRLQGGIASTPEKPQRQVQLGNKPTTTTTGQVARPAGFESNTFSTPPQTAPADRPLPAMRPAAHASVPPEPMVKPSPVEAPSLDSLRMTSTSSAPAQQAQAMAPEPSQNAVSTITEVETKPDPMEVISEPKVRPSVRESRPSPAPRRVRPGSTQGAIEVLGAGLMISSSSRRRRNGNGKLYWVLGFLLLGASAATAWHFFLR
ncbi:MAG: signal recognition particle receptor subunit beta [Planctomycetota bacterium]|jgi:signal recognition particle receptor subunit beta